MAAGKRSCALQARQRIALGLSILLGLAAASPRLCFAQSDTTRPAVESNAQPIKPPDTVEELEKLRSELADELAQLNTTTAPASSAPATQAAEADAAREATAALSSALEEFIAQLDQHIALRNQIANLRSPETVELLSKDLAAMQRRTTELAAQIAEPPPTASDQDLAKAVGEYDEKQQELDTRTGWQADRVNALAEAPQRHQQAAEAAQAAAAAFQEQSGPLRAKLEAAKKPDERRRAAQQVRKVQIEASVPLFQAEYEKLAEQRDTILRSQDERRIAILQQLAARLADWKAALQQVRARGERERIVAQLEFAERHGQTTQPFSPTYWSLRLVQLNAREELQKREQDVRARFTQAAAAELQQTLANERVAWTFFMQSLERRPSGQVRERYRKVEAGITQWQRKLTQMRRALDESADEQQDIVAKIDGFDDEIRVLEQRLTEQMNAYLLAHPDDTRVQRYTPQFGRAKTDYVEQAEAARTGAAELTKRLQDAADAVDAHLTNLQQYRSRLYWRYLFVPERPVWSWRPSALQEEWRSEASQHAKVLASLRQSAQTISPVQWAFTLVALVCVEILALGARRRTRRYADAIVQGLEEVKATEEEELAPIANRLHLFVVRFVGRTAPLVWPAIAAAVFVPAYGVCNPASRVALSVLAFFVAAVLAEAAIHALFLPGKPRQRLLRCSNVVAAYYRRWAMVLWTVTILLVPVPLLLRSVEWSYALRVTLWNGCAIIALVVALVFALRRQLVLRVAGRPEQIQHRWIFGSISAAYWLLWTATAGLLALEVAGYGALVAYAILGIAETVATIALAQLASRYVTDLVHRLQKLRAPDEPQAAAPEATESAADGRDLGLGLALGVFRWCIAGTALLAVLYFWGITAVEIKAALTYQVVTADAAAGRPPISVARILAAVLAVVVAWWGSRALRAFLNARVYPTYAGVDRGARAAINTVLHYSIVLMGLYFALSALRVPLGALTVVLGTLGLGVGLGLQPLFINFISGLMILFERHVRIGDLIAVNGEVGEVTGVSMRSTRIRTGDGIELVIPNSDLVTHSVVNWTLHDTRLRGRVPINVAYGTDVDLVKRLLSDILNRHPLVLKHPAPEVWFTAFGENSLDFEIAAWFRDAAARGQFLNSIRYDITRAFREHDIDIPSPQRTLSVLGGGALPVRLVPDSGSPQPGAAQRPANPGTQPTPPPTERT